MVEKNLIEVEDITEEENNEVVYLEGVLMENGEFVHKGKSTYINDNDKVFKEVK